MPNNSFLYGELVLKAGDGHFVLDPSGPHCRGSRQVHHARQRPRRIFVTILIDIAGAIVGGFLGSFIGLGKVKSFDLGGIFIATIVAILLLIVYRLLRKRS